MVRIAVEVSYAEMDWDSVVIEYSFNSYLLFVFWELRYAV